MRYKFQMENGYIADGPVDIVITNYIAEIENVTPATQLLIDAHGGQLIEEKPKKKRKVNPVKWEKEKPEEFTKTKELLGIIREASDDSSGS